MLVSIQQPSTSKAFPQFDRTHQWAGRTSHSLVIQYTVGPLQHASLPLPVIFQNIEKKYSLWAIWWPHPGFLDDYWSPLCNQCNPFTPHSISSTRSHVQLYDTASFQKDLGYFFPYLKTFCCVTPHTDAINVLLALRSFLLFQYGSIHDKWQGCFHSWGSWFQVYWTFLLVKANCHLHFATRGTEKNILAISAVA